MRWRFRRQQISQLHRGGSTKNVTPIGAKGIQKNLLGNPVPPPCRITNISPIGSCVAGAFKTARIHKCLYQNGANMVAFRPVFSQATKRQRQYVGSKIGHLYCGQDQKTVVAYHKMQVRSASPFCPSNELVPRSKRPCRRTESQCPKISMLRTFNNITDLSTAQRSASQIVVPIQKSKPNLGFFAISTAYGLNTDFAQLVQSTAQLRNIRLSGDLCSSLESISFFLPRQIHNTSTIQLGQSFTATHLFESTVGRTPIQPLANPP